MTVAKPSRPSERGETFTGVLLLLSAMVTTAVVAGLIGAGLAMPAVGAAGAGARAGVNFFEALPAVLKQTPLAQQSKIRAADGSLIATFYSENRISVPLAQVSPAMTKAQVAIEDYRFYEHGGVDLKGIARAAVRNASSDSQQGASTLTQQYVKLSLQENAIYSGDEAAAREAVEKNYARKLRELKYAVTLEQNLSKDKILEGYLNIAYFGDGAYGVEAASRHYFGINAKKLNLPQAALLAGIVQQPNAFNPRTRLKASNGRRNVVLARMFQTGAISRKDFVKARDTPVRLKISPTGNGCDTSRYGYFCNYVYRTLLQDPTFGATVGERRNRILRGGLDVTTTLDPKMQAQAQKALDERVPAYNSEGAAGAMSVIQPGTGKILAMVQNTRYRNKAGRGYDAQNYNVDKAYGGTIGFQQGSTFKAYTLAAALEEGIPLSSTIDAPEGGTNFSRSDFKLDGDCVDNRAPTYAPFNSEGPGKAGTYSLTEITADSINTAFVRLSGEVGLCKVRDMAARLGVHLAAPVAAGQPDEKPSTGLRAYSSLTLGAENVAPLSVAASYAAFAANGVYCAPLAVASVSVGGKPQPAPKQQCNQAIEPDVARGVTTAMQAVLTEGTGRGLGLGRPAAGKTGTTNSSTDVWFAGYTPQLSSAVWVGHTKDSKPGADDALRTLNGMRLGDRRYGTVYGATISGPIWQDFMRDALRGVPEQDFDDASDKVVNGDRVAVPSTYGMGLDRAEDVIREAGLRPRVSGSRISSDAPRGRSAGSSPRSGNRVAPGSTVTIYASRGREARRPSPAPTPSAPAAPAPPATPAAQPAR
ncbi:MAG TPA: transglycosylase domain-containing protein [Actinomycetales bacterium]